MSEFPKMIYRPGSATSQEIWGHRLDTRIVGSLAEQNDAVRVGWFVDPQDAIAQIGKNAKKDERWKKTRGHLKSAFSLALGIVTAIIAAGLAKWLGWT